MNLIPHLCGEGTIKEEVIMTLTTITKATTRYRLSTKQDQSILSVEPILNGHPSNKAAFGNVAREPYAFKPCDFGERVPKMIPKRGDSENPSGSESPLNLGWYK